MNSNRLNTCLSADCEDVEDRLFAKKEGHCVSTAYDPVRVGSVCNINCFKGCSLMDGSDTLVLNCVNINGITLWDKPIPTQCLQQTQCQPFGPIKDGSSCVSGSVGDICTLTCNEGQHIKHWLLINYLRDVFNFRFEFDWI